MGFRATVPMWLLASLSCLPPVALLYDAGDGRGSGTAGAASSAATTSALAVSIAPNVGLLTARGRDAWARGTSPSIISEEIAKGTFLIPLGPSLRTPPHAASTAV